MRKKPRWKIVAAAVIGFLLAVLGMAKVYLDAPEEDDSAPVQEPVEVGPPPDCACHDCPR